MSTIPATTTEPNLDPDSEVLDYEIADEVQADTPEALKALADGTRLAILDLLLERAATTSHVAQALGKPKGTVGYHLRVLEKCGLNLIVRTRQVRALTEEYYGRTGRTITLSSSGPIQDPLFIVRDARSDVQIIEGAPLPMFTARRVRISESRALEFASRLASLAAKTASGELPADDAAAIGREAITETGLPGAVPPGPDDDA